MALVLKPHTATVTKVSAVKEGNRVVRYTRASAGTVLGQLTEKRAEEVREGYGLETRFSAIWLMDLGSGVEITAGDRLTVHGRTYRVMTAPRVCDAESRTSHLSVLCERDDAWD